MTAAPDERHLRRTLELARLARERGTHPFGALLADARGSVVEAENTLVTDTDWTGHAELNAVRAAGAALGLVDLGTYTLYASTEPCAMCTSAAYWAGVGRIVFALGAETFREVVQDPCAARSRNATIRAATLVYITTAFSKLSHFSSRRASMRQPLFSVK